MAQRQRVIGLLTAALLLTPAASTHANPLDVRLNEVQVLGSHNSYHIRPEQRILDVLGLFDATLPIGLDYTHIPLTDQFTTQGIRQIELDVFADPLGGLYSDRAAFIFFGEDPASGLPELDEPGFKVLHVQDIDFDTTCLTLVGCLQEVKAWSDANPEHVPIMILIEAKDDTIPDPVDLGFVIPIPIGPVELDELDAEIRSVFPPDRLITPDDVRGAHASLEDAIFTDGWPSLWESRGKVMFGLDNGGGVRSDYIAGHPALAGRVMFTDSPTGTPEAAFLKVNGPVGNEQYIADRVADGYIIRTRADADTLEARANSTTRRDIALASGAQFISTDYPIPNPAFGTDYFVEIPGGNPARCNPVNGPFDCLSPALERLDGFVEVAGKKLTVSDRGPDRRKITVRLVDGFINMPIAGSGDEPTTAGATLMLSNPSTGETEQYAMPATGTHWKALGSPPGRTGYKYSDPDTSLGPCKSLRMLRKRREIRAKCIVKNSPIDFSLDEPSQGTLDVTLQLGDGDTYCASFGGTVKTDQSSSTGRGLFLATDAPAGGCPAP